MNKGKIVSNFYLIRIDNKPIYIGYTNRSLKQRFREHIHQKDLPEDATIELVGKLEFDFSWNEQLISEEAVKVSNMESYLISKFGTENSYYQKGIGDKLGGQTFANVKGFVHNNRYNPKYVGMNNEEVLKYLENYRKRMTKLRTFISNYKDPRLTKLSQFIGSYRDPRLPKINSFIIRYRDPRLDKLHTFISSYKDPIFYKLRSFISNYRDPRLDRLRSFISHYQDPRLDRLRSFISDYKDPRLYKLRNFISDYKDPRLYKLRNFIYRCKL